MESNTIENFAGAHWPPPPARWHESPDRSTLRHPAAIKQIAQMAVRSVWESHVPPWCRPFITARLKWVWLQAGSELTWEHCGKRLILSVTEDSGARDWYQVLRFTVGHMMAYALLAELAAIAAGADTHTGSVPIYRQGAPAAQWFLALQERSWDQTGAAVASTRAMAKEVLAAWGLCEPAAIDAGTPSRTSTRGASTAPLLCTPGVPDGGGRRRAQG